MFLKSVCDFNSKLFVMGLFFLTLAACSSSTQNALVGDYNAAASCPETGCADNTPTSDNVYLQRDVNKTFQLGPREGILEITGTCSASTFPDNRIEITQAGDPVVFHAFNLGTSSLIPKCSMGKFNLFIDACRFREARSYNVQVSLRPIDANQQTLEAGANFNVTFNRAAAVSATVCPL